MMIRTVSLASTSALVGAGLTYFLLATPEASNLEPTVQSSANDGARVASHEPPATVAIEPRLVSFLDGRFDVGERAAVYGIAAKAGVETLRAMARELWAKDKSANREFALDVIFSRMTEIDPNAGIQLVQEGSPDREQLFAAALSIIAAQGVTEANMSRLLSVLRELDERRFRTAALMRLADSHPDQAVALAVALRDRGLRIGLLREIAMAWFAHDPTAARAALATLADNANRRAFEAGIRTRLAQTDPEQVLLEAGRRATLSDDPSDTASAARELAKTDPRRALELADRLAGEARETALKAAIHEWSSTDPYGALGLVEKLGQGRDRDALLQAVGQELGRQDPEGALAWFRSLSTIPQGLYGAILQGIAQDEPRRALELALDSTDPSAEQSLMLFTSAALQSGDVSFAHVAERMIAMDNRASREPGIQLLLSAWVNDKPEEALRWIAGHSDKVGRAALGQAAATLARKDPDAAIRYTETLPAEYRDGWISAVALGYAQHDPAGAKVWMEQFRGKAIYDAGMTAIVRAAVIQHPAEAAAMLPSFAEAATRDEVATNVAQQWSMREPRAAQDWAATLPAGPLRDAALTGTMMMSDEVPEAATLVLFQSDQARQQAILNIAYRRARDNVDDARAIVKRHIADLGLRGQAEQKFQRIESRPHGPFGD